MSNTIRVLLAAGAFAALSATPGSLAAQAAQSGTVDSLAYPRQFVQWVLTARGDSAFAHAGPTLRDAMKSVEGVNEMATRIATRFGEKQGTDAEIQFDEGELKVYIAVVRYSQAPEPAAWMVAYSPSTKVVERAGFTSLSNVKSRYPNAKLP